MAVIRAATDNEGFTEAYQRSIMTEAERKADAGLVISFRKHPVVDAEASAKAGRPIHIERDYITIIAPGDKQSTIDREWGWPNDERRFGHLYEKWLAANREGDGLVGTPLAAWPVISKAQIKDLEFFHVRTVEQLAAMADNNAQSVGPIMALRQQARDFIAAAEKGAATTQMRSEIDEAKSENAALKAALAKMQEQIDSLTAPPAQARPPVQTTGRRG